MHHIVHKIMHMNVTSNYGYNINVLKVQYFHLQNNEKNCTVSLNINILIKSTF